MSRESTRLALLEAGCRLFLRKGYASAGLDAILREAQVPRGSFYFYFPSKEDFGLGVLQYFSRHDEERLAERLRDTSRPPLDRLRSYFEETLAKLEQQECRNGCLIGRLGQEMADQSERFREELVRIFDRRIELVANCLREAQDRGEAPVEMDPRAAAEFGLIGWQGALMRSKIVRSTTPLRGFIDMLFATILGRPATPTNCEPACEPPSLNGRTEEATFSTDPPHTERRPPSPDCHEDTFHD